MLFLEDLWNFSTPQLELEMSMLYLSLMVFVNIGWCEHELPICAATGLIWKIINSQNLKAISPRRVSTLCRSLLFQKKWEWWKRNYWTFWKINKVSSSTWMFTQIIFWDLAVIFLHYTFVDWHLEKQGFPLFFLASSRSSFNIVVSVAQSRKSTMLVFFLRLKNNNSAVESILQLKWSASRTALTCFFYG